MPYDLTAESPYYIDHRARVKELQKAMEKNGIDVYLASRPRTMSFILDAFCPWRSYLVILSKGDPVLFTFVIDAIRLADETWLPEDCVRAYAPMGGMDQISAVSGFILEELGLERGRLGYEDGLSTWTPEGYLSHYEYESFSHALKGFEFVNSHTLVDAMSVIKDAGTIARFREASRQVDEGHAAVREALGNGGWKGLTETVVAGIGALAMRRAGSVSEWNFAGLNELSSGRRTALGACTPPTTRPLGAGEPLMVDLHSMFRLALGDHSHNYLIGPASAKLRRHADNFVDLVTTVLEAWKEGSTPSSLAEVMFARAEKLGCSDYVVPGCEHGIGLFGDEWRIGSDSDSPIPYWTDPDHGYRAGELVICAMQYAAPEDEAGFRYENPILIGKLGVETLSKYPLGIEEIV